MAPHNKIKHTLRLTLIGLSLLALPVCAQTQTADDLNGITTAAKKAVRMQNFEQAFNLYKNAAEKGSSQAQYQLSNMLQQGLGTQQNENLAKTWLAKAAAQGHPAAQYGLSQLITKSDPKKALSLLKASADQGYTAAQTQLSRTSLETSNQHSAPVDALWFGAARNNEVLKMQALLPSKESINFTDAANRTALFYAIESGSEEAANWLIQNGININHQDDYGLTAIQTALERGQSNIFKTLIRAKVDPQQVFNNGDNLLHYAIRLKKYDYVSPLIEKGVSVNTQNNEGWTPLDLAEYQQSQTTIDQLKKRGGVNGKGWRSEREPQNLVDISEQLVNQTSASPPVAMAIINRNKPLLIRLLNQDSSLVNTKLDNDTTLLTLAIKQNKPEFVSVLLAHGADVNQPSYNKASPLQVATRLGHINIVKTLLEAGASPTQTDQNGDDALINAIEERQHDIASLLINNIEGQSTNDTTIKSNLKNTKAPVDRYILLATQHQSAYVLKRLLPFASKTAAIDDQQRNALWFAAKFSNPKLIRKLLSAGIPATQEDNLGRTPLTISVDQSCLECARQLLSHSDLNHQTHTGNTPLILAAANGDALLSAWLIKNNVEIDVRNNRGNTALMMAVSANSLKVVQQLITAKANMTRKNKLGFSAIDLAKEAGPEMIKLLDMNSVFGIF